MVKPISALLIASSLLLACALPAGEAPALTATALAGDSTPTPAPTEVPIPPTPVQPSPTPVSPPISVNSVADLSIFSTFGQGEVIRSLAFSPDGSTLASAAGNAEDFDIRLWEASSGLPLGVLRGHTSIVWTVAFSPDGRWLASASSDRTVRIWDWRSGSSIETLDFPNEVISVTFSPDGQILAAGGVEAWPNAAVWTYAVDSWEPLARLAEFWNIPALAYSPDGQFLVGGGTSRTVRIWRTSDGVSRSSLYHAGQVSSLDVSPDGSTIASGLCAASGANNVCSRGAVWLWDLAAGTLINKLADFPDWVQGVAFSPDGSLVMGGSRDGMLGFYSMSDLQSVRVADSPGGVGALAYSADGRYLASGGDSGQIHLWKVGP
jgi:WD40 repeat protein